MRMLLLLALPAALWAQPTVTSSSVITKWSSHSTAFVQWSLNTTASHHRLLYSTASACGAATDGGTVPADFNGSAMTNIQAVWSGGHYSTTYHLCPQSSFDGTTWSSGTDLTYVTPALPSPHPALPVAATTFSVAMPNLSGTVAFTVSTGCADLLTKWTAAETQRATTHAALVIADPSGCGVTGFYPPGASDARYFTTGNVNTGTNTITYNAHGFSNGNSLIFGSDERVGSPPSGIQQSYNYYACNITTNTFQVCSDVGLTMVVALGSTGATGQCVYSPQTQSNNELFIVAEWPLGNNWRVPEGVRYENADWAGTAHGKIYLNTIGTSPRLGLIQQCAHNWRFMNENTTGQTVEDPTTTTDPTPWGGLWQVAFSTSHIFFDRAWNHGQGYPDRLLHGTYIDGRGNAVINSEFDTMDYWLAYRKTSADLIPTITGGGSTISISTGTFMLGYQNCTLGTTATFTRTSGTPSGTALVYYSMDCTLHVVGPTGLVGTCVNCTFSTSGSPAFPVNGSSNLAAGRLGQITVASGTFGAVSTTYRTFENSPTMFTSAGEGPTGILGPCAFGTGPTMIVNNKIEAAGIGLHSDDSCTLSQYANPGSNLTLNRNDLTLRLSWNPNDPSFDNRMRLVRNLFEVKQGPVVTVTGNMFSNQWSSITPQGYAGIIFPTLLTRGTTNAQMTDIDFENNSATNMSAGFQLVASEPGTIGLPPSMLRTKLANNLIQLSATQYDPALKDGTGLLGLCVFGWGGIEDLIRDHETCISPIDFLDYQINNQREGYNFTNSIAVISDPIARLGLGIELDYSGTLPAPPMTFGKSLMDWMDTQGANNPVYTLTSVFVPWTSANATNWAAGWSGSGATVECAGSCGSSTAASRIAAVGFTNFATGNYALTSMSPYHNAAPDGQDYGTLFPTLYNAQGIVGTPSVSALMDTSATITTITPDTFGCSVMVSLDNFTTAVIFPYSGSPSTTQAVGLSGLLGNTNYSFKVLCAVEQPGGSFVTSGMPLGNKIKQNSFVRGTVIR